MWFYLFLVDYFNMFCDIKTKKCNVDKVFDSLVLFFFVFMKGIACRKHQIACLKNDVEVTMSRYSNQNRVHDS
jgi:hypothetical protein